MTLTFSHLSADSFEAHLKAGRKRPRVREAVSCWQCRTRKTRCDRESPCGQCKHRGIALDCAYSTPKDRQSAAPRSRSRVAKQPPAATPTSGQTPQHYFPETQTYTPPDSCSSRGETPEPASASLPTLVSAPASRVQRSEQPNVRVSPTPGGTAFRGSAFKTRMIGLSHWMAPCNEMIVLKAMLDHSPEFHTSRKAFAELKVQLRTQNAVPAPPFSADCAALRMLLPERRQCDAWLAKYLQSYGRIYGILDEPAFMRDYEMIYAGTLNHPVHISKILLSVAIAMQSSEPDRLEGRRLARAVEDCIHTSKFQKPCVGVVQVLLLLLVLKTISASDTDKIYDLLALQGLTTQVVSSMGLQRDPALFAEVTPYYAELRKRLWACFVRLNLEYCVRSGTQFSLRLDESDCPLPMELSLRTLQEESDGAPDMMREEQEVTDMAFAIAAAKLARIIGPLHQALYSPNPPSPVKLQKDLRAGFGQLLSELPPALKPGAKPSGPIEEMQRCLISIPMTSFLSIGSLGATLGTPADASQRSQLLDLWDNAASVLSQFQNLCERNREIGVMACQFLWTDAARSALTSCWILGRLRQLDNNRIICYPQQTGGMFREVLTKSLVFLSGLWQARYHLGVVAAKLNLLLAVSLNVTANLHTDEVDPASFRQKLLADASAAAEALIAGMRCDLQQRQQPTVPTTLVAVHGTSSLGPANGICATWSPGNTDLLGVTEPLSSVSTPLMGHDFLAIDFPCDTTFPSLYHDFGFPVLGDGMFQGGGSLPTFDEQTMGSMW